MSESLVNATEAIKIVDYMKDIITPIGIEVYKVYYTQMLYTGIINVFVDCIIILSTLLFPFLVYKLHHKHWDFIYDNDLEIPVFMISAGVAITLIVLFLAAISALPEDIMHIVNPNYYIIQNLLHGV